LSAKTFFEAICKPVYFYLFYNNFKSFNIIMNPRKYHNLVAASNFGLLSILYSNTIFGTSTPTLLHFHN